MTAKKVFVTGGAGQTGISTVKWVSTHEKNLDVYAGMHKGEEYKQQQALELHQVKPTVIEAADKKDLARHFKDVQDLFVIPPSTEDKVAFACNYIDAAKEAKVKFVLLLSVAGAERPDYIWGRQFKEIEDHCKKTIDNWCVLRTSFYMQNLLLYKNQIQEGTLPLPIGKGRFAPIDVTDVGAVAGKILSDCTAHKNKTYEITGSTVMDGEAMADVFSKTLGRPIEFKDITPEEAKTVLKSQNVPDVEIQGLLDFYQLVKVGEFDQADKNFESVFKMPQKTLNTFVNENKDKIAPQKTT